jgi:prepilin-type N-terminal cleavage/methylation domain-containing protein
MNQTAAKTALQTAQQGFSLIEIAIALALAAVISINYLYNQSQDNEISRAKVQAGYFMTVNDAMGSYMQQYYDQLRVLPGECSLVRLKTGVTPSLAKCWQNLSAIFDGSIANAGKADTTAATNPPTMTSRRLIVMFASMGLLVQRLDDFISDLMQF